MEKMMQDGQVRAGAAGGSEAALHGHFAMLARYHVWATGKLLAAVAPLDEARYRRDCGLFFGSVHGTLNHLLVGERIWYARIAEGDSPVLRLNAELESGRPALAQALETAAGRWSGWLASLDCARLAENLSYRTTAGKPVTVPFAGALAHVYNHGTHHRGQISAALTTMGAVCPELDLIYFLVAEGNK